MKRIRRLWRQLAATIIRTDREDELAAEIEEHLQAQTEDNVRSGMSWEKARRATLLKFGSLASAKEQYRDQLRLPPVETLLQDLRFALRAFGKRPAFVVVLVLSLAIGIGLNTTIFTWLKAVYFNPLPGVRDARHLVTINAAYKFGDGYSGFDLYLNLGMDWTVIAFLFVITFCTSLLFGLLPAFETSKVDIVDSLKEGSGTLTAGRRRTLWRKSLVAGQVALAMTALFAAALFTAYLHQVISANRGFETKKILTAGTDLSAAGMSETRGRIFYRESIRRLDQLPGVESAAWTTFLPMNGSGGGNRREVEVRGYSTPQGKPLSIIVDTVSAGYLRTLGIAVLRGREFEPSDTESSAPVLMVNQKFVDEYLKGRDPVGAAVRIDGKWRSIIGVHRNYVYRDPTQPTRPTIFLPLAQDYSPSAIVVIRSKTDPAPLLLPLRRIVSEFDRNIPLVSVMTMEENVGYHFIEAKAGTGALVLFAAVACLLAAIGIYAVLAGFINQRRREFAIRIALGAQPGDVRTRILTESALITLAGVTIGLSLSMALGELLKSALYAVSPFDPWLYAAAALVLAMTVALSSVPSAFAASRMDANIALRRE